MTIWQGTVSVNRSVLVLGTAAFMVIILRRVLDQGQLNETWSAASSYNLVLDIIRSSEGGSAIPGVNAPIRMEKKQLAKHLPNP